MQAGEKDFKYKKKNTLSSLLVVIAIFKNMYLKPVKDSTYHYSSAVATKRILSTPIDFRLRKNKAW